MGKDYYSILGIPKDADDDAVKKAYKKMVIHFPHLFQTFDRILGLEMAPRSQCRKDGGG
jgi:preprotein translocase subunit Sec63